MRIHHLCFAVALPLGINAAEPLTLEHTIPLPGVHGRFDHFACDATGKKLALAALGNNTGEVFDLASMKHVQSITGLRKPTGVLMLPKPDRIYIANGDDGTFRTFDASTYTSAAKLGGLNDADNVRFDPLVNLIYIGYGAGALGVVDRNTGKLFQSIPLAGHPESFRLEASAPRIFVNVPDRKQIAVVDRIQGKVIATWPMEKWQANFPMALDEGGKRLFIGCRNPARLVVLDTERGTPVADVEISGDTDDLFIDPKRHMIYVSCGEGFLDVIGQTADGHYERAAKIATREGARTCFFSPELDRLYLAVPERGDQQAEMRVFAPAD